MHNALKDNRPINIYIYDYVSKLYTYSQIYLEGDRKGLKSACICVDQTWATLGVWQRIETMSANAIQEIKSLEISHRYIFMILWIVY